jgi:hypothetical protein
MSSRTSLDLALDVQDQEHRGVPGPISVMTSKYRSWTLPSVPPEISTCRKLRVVLYAMVRVLHREVRPKHAANAPAEAR